jgi:hypothetical protein
VSSTATAFAAAASCAATGWLVLARAAPYAQFGFRFLSFFILFSSIFFNNRASEQARF